MNSIKKTVTGIQELHELLTECQQTCESCVYDCSAQVGQTTRGQACLDCTPICSACVKLASNNPDLAPKLCQLCAELCQLCTADSRDHGEQHDSECISACRHCAERCLAVTA